MKPHKRFLKTWNKELLDSGFGSGVVATFFNADLSSLLTT